MPEARWIELGPTATIFNSFFEIRNFNFGYYGKETYFGIFEDNDPKKRLMAVAGHNQDLGEFWEFSDTGHDAGRPLERGVQVWRELFHLWTDSLTSASFAVPKVARSR